MSLCNLSSQNVYLPQDKQLLEHLDNLTRVNFLNKNGLNNLMKNIHNNSIVR